MRWVAFGLPLLREWPFIEGTRSELGFVPAMTLPLLREWPFIEGFSLEGESDAGVASCHSFGSGLSLRGCLTITGGKLIPRVATPSGVAFH